MPWSSWKHPLDKTEFIVPMNACPLQKKHLQYFLKWYLKVVYLNIKALWNTVSEVLYLYCNVVVHNQAGTTRNDWTDRKQIFHRYTKLHTSQKKQACVDCCCRGCSHPNPDTKALPPPFPHFFEEFLNILIQF